MTYVMSIIRSLVTNSKVFLMEFNQFVCKDRWTDDESTKQCSVNDTNIFLIN